jgi:hypothetical protein
LPEGKETFIRNAQKQKTAAANIAWLAPHIQVPRTIFGTVLTILLWTILIGALGGGALYFLPQLMPNMPDIGGWFPPKVPVAKGGLTPYLEGGKYGYQDENGKIIIPLKYDTAYDFSNNGLARVALNHRYGFIDKTGKEVIELKYDGASDFSKEEGLAIVLIGSQSGFINTGGKEVTEIKYDVARPFTEGLAAVKIGSRAGFINTSGKEVIEMQYTDVRPFSNGFAKVAFKDTWGIIDKKGKEIIVPRYAENEIDAGPGGKGFNLVVVKRKFGFFDEYGKEIVYPRYDIALPFSEGLAMVGFQRDNGGERFGFIDQKGEEVIPPMYDIARPFSEGLAMVGYRRDNGGVRCGFIDKNNKEVIPIKYDEALPFTEGLAAVKSDRNMGFIDKSGKEVIRLRYDEVTPFSGGFACVALGTGSQTRWGIINAKGKEVVPLRYDAIIYSLRPNKFSFRRPLEQVLKDGFRIFRNNLACVKSDGKWGFVNQEGKEIVPPKYDEIIGWDNFEGKGTVQVNRGGLIGTVDKYGKEGKNWEDPELQIRIRKQREREEQEERERQVKAAEDKRHQEEKERFDTLRINSGTIDKMRNSYWGKEFRQDCDFLSNRLSWSQQDLLTALNGKTAKEVHTYRLDKEAFLKLTVSRENIGNLY